MKVLLVGAAGHMGKEVISLASDAKFDAEIVAGVDTYAKTDVVPCVNSFDDADNNVDVIIDFSNHINTKALLDFAIKNNLPLVLATTGQTDEEKQMIIDASKKIPLFFAANYSIGVAVLIDLVKKAASMFPNADIEIVETHHVRKLDAPSGTALTIANELATVRKNAKIKTGRSGYGKREKDEIGIQSIRLGNVVGIHEVLISTGNETLTLKHEAHSRALFAEGALVAAKYIIGKNPGLYDMKSIM